MTMSAPFIMSDGHATSRPFVGEGPCGPEDTRLGRAIGRMVPQRHRRRLRRNVDYLAPPRLEHMPSHRLRHQEHALQVDRQRRVPFRYPEVLRRAWEGNSGVVDACFLLTHGYFP